MGETTTAVIPDDVKEQAELKKEMAELREGEAVSAEVKPAEATEVKTEETKASNISAVGASVKAPEEKTEVKSAEPEIDYKAEFEKVKTHKDNLEKALQEMRHKRKQDLETLAVLQSRKPEVKETEGEETKERDTSIDPEVTKIIKFTVAPELEEVKAEIRVQRFQQDEASVIAREGKDKYKTAMDAFTEMITPESHLYDTAIHESFMKSKTPAQFAFRVGMAQGLDGYIETIRKETADKTRKDVLEELKNSANKTIPSLSTVNGAKPAIKDGSPSLRTEMNELRNL